MAKKKRQSNTQEIGIDFKKIKRNFSGNKGLLSFFSKNRVIILVLSFILLSIIFSVHYRSYPSDLPMTQDLAENSIKNMVKNNIASQAKSKYPNLPQDQLKEIINKQTSSVLSQGQLNYQGQTIQIDQIVQQQSNYFKEKLKHDDGNTYLLAIDPYYYYRHTRNYLIEGNEWGAEHDGKYYDPLVLGGTPDEKRSFNEKPVKSLHVYFSAFVYKLMSFFNGNISLMAAMFWVPVIVSSLCVIPAYFIGRKITGDFGGLVSAMLVALHPALISRTAAGFADTDAYNIFFPLVSVWFFLEALDSKNVKHASIWGALTGLFLGLFAFAWQGWYYMLLFLFMTGIGCIVYKLIAKRKGKYGVGKAFKDVAVKQWSIVTGILILASFIFVSFLASFKEFMRVFSIFSFTKIKVVGISKIWPNVYTTVAELNPAKLSSALKQISMSSDFLLLFALIGISLPLVFYKGKKKETSWSGWLFTGFLVLWSLFLVNISKSLDNGHVFFALMLALPSAAYGIYKAVIKEDIPIHYTILLLVWFIGTIYATSKGVRFVILAAPAFSIASGIVIGKIIDPLTKIAKMMDLKPLFFRIPAALIIFVLMFAPVIPGNVASKAENMAKNEIPSMNDAWYNTLTKIKDNSANDAIINSWWDFGHWFAAIGNRSVTLDGGRQNSPQAHWLGKLMLTSNETESVGILRYLDCGANTGYNELLKYNNKSELPRYNTIQQIYSILGKSRSDALNILQTGGISADDADKVLQYTHCEPPENYFITSEDMVGKSGVWAHFGAWDFSRATMFNKVHNHKKSEAINILQDDFSLEPDEAKNKYYELMDADADQWISPWPSYAGNSRCSLDNSTIKCNNGLSFNLEKEVLLNDMTKSTQKPKNIAYIKNGTFKVKEYNNNLIKLRNSNSVHESFLGVALVPENGGYEAIMMDSRLTDSIFTRLFYFENMDGGLKHFEKFHKTRDINGQKIIVWKVDWSGKAESSANKSEESVFNV
ncbi:MAG: STT3 domain-containing protein [Nanobdellota archaeon]